ncbi:TrmH family RNA methyltransferase [Vallitalea okinawensis]|uniref:TrmH family RNA methyltransferase n=1 Tax=Vallitalea okinawensis TaxID=2078660 RepID=UPI000CFC49EF|nr:TrmH family RNA methyltransferase [Vallitalea okinawensis]
MKPKIIKVYNKNNEYQHIQVLKRNRKKRSKFNEFFVEGAKSITYAVQNNWKILSFIYCTETELSLWAKNILNNSTAEKHIELSAQLMTDLSDKDEDVSEILAIVSIPENNLERIKLYDNPLIVIFDRPSNHGNLGTLIRSCEALNVDGLIITGHAVDLYDVKTIRASLGTFFSIPIIRLDSHKEVSNWLEKIKEEYNNFQIIGSTSQTETSIEKADFSRPTALLIGNETKGLSFKYKEMCDALVKIPMYGEITSFNVSCAASIMLYEIDRQRRGA